MEETAKKDLVRHLSAIPSEEKQAKLDAAMEKRIAKLGVGEALPRGMTMEDLDALKARQKARQRNAKVNPAFHLPGVDDRQVFNEAQIEFTAVKRRNNDDTTSFRVQCSTEMASAIELLIRRDDNSFTTPASFFRHCAVLGMYEQQDRGTAPTEVVRAIRNAIVLQREMFELGVTEAIQSLEDQVRSASASNSPQLLRVLLDTAISYLEEAEEGSDRWKTLDNLINKYS